MGDRLRVINKMGNNGLENSHPFHVTYDAKMKKCLLSKDEI